MEKKKKSSEKKFDISEFQWYSLVINAVFGIGVTTLPRELSDVAGRDGWISIIIATLLILCYSYICITYSKMFPTKSLVQSMQTVLGKPLGIIISLAYILYTLIVTGIVVRLFLEIIYVYFDLVYPYYIPIALFIIPVIYMARSGLATLSRMSEIVLVFSFTAIVLFLFPDRTPSWLELLPVFENGYTGVLKAIPDVGFSFLGVEIILVFYPYIEKKKSVLRVTSMGVMTSGLLYAALFVGTIVFLGMGLVQVVFWPFIEYLKLVRIELFERMDNIFLYIWTAKIVMVMAIQYFSGTFSLALLTGKKYHDTWAITMWVIPFAVAYFIPDVLTLQDFTAKVSMFGGILILVLPIILLIVAKIRGIN